MVRMRPSGARHGAHRPAVSQQRLGRDSADSSRATQFATVNKRPLATFARCLRLKLAGHVGLEDRCPRASRPAWREAGSPAVSAGRSATSDTRASGNWWTLRSQVVLPATELTSHEMPSESSSYPRASSGRMSTRRLCQRERADTTPASIGRASRPSPVKAGGSRERLPRP